MRSSFGRRESGRGKYSPRNKRMDGGCLLPVNFGSPVGDIWYSLVWQAATSFAQATGFASLLAIPPCRQLATDNASPGSVRL
jgi:hypothetical protein